MQGVERNYLHWQRSFKMAISVCKGGNMAIEEFLAQLRFPGSTNTHGGRGLLQARWLTLSLRRLD